MFVSLHDILANSALSSCKTFYRPDFYQTPSEKQQFRWFQLGFLMFAYPFYPVVIQRIYSADSLKSIRAGAYANFVGELCVKDKMGLRCKLQSQEMQMRISEFLFRLSFSQDLGPPH